MSEEERKLEKTKVELSQLPKVFTEAERKLKEEIELIEKKKNDQLKQLDEKINTRIEEAKKKKEELKSIEIELEGRKKELQRLTK